MYWVLETSALLVKVREKGTRHKHPPARKGANSLRCVHTKKREEQFRERERARAQEVLPGVCTARGREGRAAFLVSTDPQDLPALCWPSF